jgi:DNA-binding response OmpR family regulator
MKITQGVNKHKIAVIEDNISICEMYEFKLKKSGFDVKTAHDGTEGLKLLETFRPDLILLDLLMPVMNGDEMLKQIRDKEWGRDIRVIILTNISKDEAPHVLRLLHIDRYIVKAHHTPRQVLEIVNEILETKDDH